MSDTCRSYRMEHQSRRSRPSQICEAFEQLTGGEKLTKADADHQFYPSTPSRTSEYSTIRSYMSRPDCIDARSSTRNYSQTDHSLQTHGQQRYHSDNPSCERTHPSSLSSDYYGGTFSGRTYRETPLRKGSMLGSGTSRADSRPRYQRPGESYRDDEEYVSPLSLERTEGSRVGSKAGKVTRVTRDRDGKLQLERSNSNVGRDSGKSTRDRLTTGFCKYVVGNY